MTGTNTRTTQELAREVREAFELRTRDAGSKYWACDDGTASDQSLAYRTVFAAHEDGAVLPNDYVYAAVVDVLDYIAGSEGEPDLSDDIGDLAHEFADGSTNVYTSDLLLWLSECPGAVGWVDEARNEYGASGTGISGDIAQGQYAWLRSIFDAVVGVLRDELTNEPCPGGCGLSVHTEGGE